MVELVAIDLDGTLLTSGKVVTARTQRVVRAVRQQGVRVVLASARPPRSVAETYKLLGLDTCVICYNGALIYDPPSKQVLFHRPIEKFLAREVIDLARQIYRETLVSIEVLDQWYTDRVNPAYQTEVSKQFQPDVLGPIDTWLIQPVTKVLLLGPAAKMSEVRRKIGQRFGRRLAMTQSESNLLQIMSAGVSKGTALKRVCDRYGISPQKTIAIGDAANDTDMLELAGMGIAMASASDDVKRAADYITSGNDDDGVAEALERFVL
ncbi:MAG: HAD family phosphatase [Phycisphaerae bacterium]|nr:HAD family phosphatase [Phycisphaerae bacterium]